MQTHTIPCRYAQTDAISCKYTTFGYKLAWGFHHLRDTVQVFRSNGFTVHSWHHATPRHALEVWDGGRGARNHALHTDQRVNVLGVQVANGVLHRQVKHAHLHRHTWGKLPSNTTQPHA